MPMNIEYVGDFFAYFVIAFGAIILSKYHNNIINRLFNRCGKNDQ